MAVAPVDIPKLKRRYEQLFADSAGFRSVCEQIEKYAMPRVGNDAYVTEKATESEATWKNPDVWDHTAPIAGAKLAAHIHTAVAPPGVKSAVLEWDHPKFRDNLKLKDLLEKNGDVVHREIEASDFHGELASAFLEYAVLGNMIVIEEVEERKGKWKGFDFSAPPLRECEFEDDSRGRMNRFYRALRWTPAQQKERLESAGQEVPDWLTAILTDEKRAVIPRKVLFAIYPREDVDPDAELSPLLAPELRPFGYVYFDFETGLQLGKEGGYFDFPAFIARFERTAGSRWGQGYGHYALPGVKGVNAFKELFLTRAALDADPPTKGKERSLLGDVDRTPGGYTVVEDTDDIRPLDEGLPVRHDVSGMTLEEERTEIRRIYREDELTLKDAPAMTAYEVQVRFDMMLKLLGPTIARLISEFLAPLYEVAYRALYRAGRLEKMPQEVIDENATWSVRFTGALARARRMDEVAAIERAFTFGASLVKLGFDDPKYTLDPDAALRHVQELLGAPASICRTKQEAKALRDQDRAMMERMAAAKAAKDEASAVATAAGAPTAATAGAFPVEPAPALAPGGGVA